MRPRIAAVLGGVAVLAATAFGIYLSSPKPQAPPAALPFAQTSKPKSVPDLQFVDGGGQAHSLKDFRGKQVLLNIWATWCAPCREEMPALDRLQSMFPVTEFEVIALSIDQQGAEPVRRFFAENRIKVLRLYSDPTAQAAFNLGALGVPTTLLIDRAGREIGRHTGPAKWDAPELVADFRRRLNEGPEH